MPLKSATIPGREIITGVSSASPLEKDEDEEVNDSLVLLLELDVSETAVEELLEELDCEDWLDPLDALKLFED